MGGNDFKQRVCERIFNKEIKRKRIKVITDIALPLLEVESACHNRLRCGIGRLSKLVWLHVIGIALSTPREDILELLPLDMFMKAGGF